jgi:hypothetical protein
MLMEITSKGSMLKKKQNMFLIEPKPNLHYQKEAENDSGQ